MSINIKHPFSVISTTVCQWSLTVHLALNKYTLLKVENFPGCLLFCNKFRVTEADECLKLKWSNFTKELNLSWEKTKKRFEGWYSNALNN